MTKPPRRSLTRESLRLGEAVGLLGRKQDPDFLLQQTSLLGNKFSWAFFYLFQSNTD
jgi:hypothetical protein